MSDNSDVIDLAAINELALAEGIPAAIENILQQMKVSQASIYEVIRQPVLKPFQIQWVLDKLQEDEFIKNPIHLAIITYLLKGYVPRIEG